MMFLRGLRVGKEMVIGGGTGARFYAGRTGSGRAGEKKVVVTLTNDFDGLGTWTSLYGDKARQGNVSRGEFGEVGVRRLLDLYDSLGLRGQTTFFVPTQTCEHFPDAVRSIAERGHEVGQHGDSHEMTADVSEVEEHRIVRAGMEAIESLTGKPPVGYRSPAQSFGNHTLRVLEENGFLYDSSLMNRDFELEYARHDKVLPGGGYDFGPRSSVVEIPVSWHLDDFPKREFIQGVNPSTQTTAQVVEGWREEFDYLYYRVGSGVFNLTTHPQTVGRGALLTRYEEFVQYMRSLPGVEFRRCGDVAVAYDMGFSVAGQQRADAVPVADHIAISLLSPEDKEAIGFVADRACREFVDREPMTNAMGCTYQEIYDLFYQTTRVGADHQLTLVARDTRSGEIVSAFIQTDFGRESEALGDLDVSPRVFPILEAVEILEEKYRASLEERGVRLAPGVVQHQFVVFTASHFGGRGLAKALYSAAEQQARRLKYRYQMSEPTGSITQHISMNRLKFDCLFEVNYKDYFCNHHNRHVFADIPAPPSCLCVEKDLGTATENP
mmetsp:Transcript_12430/g.35088  ORF Transcript_12430/g.35088 Transcript_12430/m.35088 type:complete len:552 (+) Transcript_12430:61-1716(+)